MAEPENLVLEHLRAICASVDRLEQRVDAFETKVEARFDMVEARLDGLETRLDGLTHAVIAGFGALVHRLDGHEKRIIRLEADRA